MITRFFLIENKNESAEYVATKVINEIQNAVGSRATPEWIAGLLTQAQSSFTGIRFKLKQLYDGAYEPSTPPDNATPQEKKEFIERERIKEINRQEAINALKVFQILYKYNLADRKPYGNDYYDYEISRSRNDRRRNEILSIIRSRSPQNAATRASALDKLKKELRTADFAAAQDFVQELPERLKTAFEIFVNLDKNDLAYLNNVYNIKEYAKKRKTNYSNIIKNKIDNGNEYFLRLQQLGIINSNGTINLNIIKSLKELLSIDNIVYKIKPIAKDLHDVLEKISSDMAYHDNAVVKRLAGSDIDKHAAEIVLSFTDKEKEIYLNKKIIQKFRELGLITPENKYSDLGKAVLILLKNRRDSLTDVKKDIGKATGREPWMGPLTPSQPDQFTQNIRKRAKVDDIKRMSKYKFFDFRK
jgi:hypothetical protein